MDVPTESLAAFNELVCKRLDYKVAEDVAIAARRKVDNELLEFSLIQENSRIKGSVSFKSEEYKLTVEYKVKETYDILSIAAAIDPSSFERIFPVKREFSQSALNALVKEMEAQVIAGTRGRGDLDALTEAVQKNRSWVPATAQIMIKDA